MRTIAVANMKGGVGKTTTTLNVGAALRDLGKKVLLIDADPQANLTISFRLETSFSENNLASLLLGLHSLKEVVVPALGMDLIPAHPIMDSVISTLNEKSLRELLLYKALKPIREANVYDYILIDCGPNLGIYTKNAMSTATDLLVPYQTAYFSYVGISTLDEYLTKIQQEVNENIELLGIVIIQYNAKERNNTKKGFADAIRDSALGEKVFSTYIRTCTALGDSPMKGQSIFEYDGNCNGAVDYLSLTKEILTRHE
ncbi:ParA family protein [Cytophagaceae bacterium DM2B3-1]|uniref:ParA family protein n=2 Tax=Xanthocytophaga TaxID=3078918 RepID=A0AAE3QSD5_9BACT|nr:MULTISPECIES: ParA family protein [Xanthocytophaga]MDJ1472342.1 ParA family protein [Xanthocytophaga flavus]MDJ1482630.1 ParA family protein [Xanthocytophaga flavus]MDJ1493039.1 ParA family protein [Xanthocytophaga flavus]MDJ1506294.1 ParA family protein [Xanthocytophaga agilis]